MLSPVPGSVCNKGLQRDQASRASSQQASVKGKSWPINLISFPELGQTSGVKTAAIPTLRLLCPAGKRTLVKIAPLKHLFAHF